MNKLTLCALSALLFTLSGCDWRGIRGNRVVITDQRAIGDFADIAAEGAFQIEWTRGAPTLAITTDQNLLPYIRSEISGNTLRLRSTERLAPSHGIKIAVTSANLNGARFEGATRFTAHQISGTSFFLDATGASRVTLDGQIGELTAGMTGASRLNAELLQTKKAELSLTGAAKAEVAVAETLKVSITGAGKVLYSGNPGTIEKSISGAGSIRRRE